MQERLIIDVGMHSGKDTEFYLRKGFDVVAVEANPALVQQVRSRLGPYLSADRLRIYDVAIADYEGEVDFYVNRQHDDWGTISTAFATRNERKGTKNSVIRVKCTTFHTILRECGVPYYLKIDIEGVDTKCLQALMTLRERPKYVSIEAGLTSFRETFTELSLLWKLGYRRFKIVNQRLNSTVRCPRPPLEGSFVDYRFDGECSGPFGEEAPGKWMSIGETFVRYRGLLLEQRYFGAGGKLHKTSVHKTYEQVKGVPTGAYGWYDFHAKIK
jgi:FkbM family methyltransferase